MLRFLSGGVSVRRDVFEPKSSGSGKFPAILLLHGAGGNAERWVGFLAPSLNRLGIALYAVHYFERTGTTRAEVATILDGVHFPLWLGTVKEAVAEIRLRPMVDPTRIALLGISLGGFLALSTAAESRNLRAVIDISGGLPEGWVRKATPAFPPTLIVHGDADTVVPVSHARDLETLLRGLGVAHQALILPSEGHWFSPGGNLRILAAVSAFLGKYL